MDAVSFEKTLGKSMTFLCITAVLPPKTDSPKIIQALFSLYTFFVTYICLIPVGVVFLVGTWFNTEDRLIMIQYAHISIHYVIAALKRQQVWMGRETIAELFRMSAEKEMMHKSAEQHQLLATYFRYWTLSANIYLISCWVVITSVMAMPLFTGMEEMPIPSWYPFDYHRSPTYEMCYIHQIIVIYINGMSNCVIDVYMAALLIYMVCQFKMLKMDLEGFETIEEVPDAEMHKRLIDVIKHHQMLLLFVQKTQDTFAYITLAQLFGNILSLTSCMYVTSEAPLGTTNFVQSAGYLVGVLLELYLYCLLGQLLISESSGLPDVLEASVPWYDYSLSFRRTFFFFLHRTQDPIVIKAGRLVDLSHETFASIIRTSYSYLTVLGQMAEN